jgi:outer membrane protein OmpA-like peptidoglycan-associated protein
VVNNVRPSAIMMQNLHRTPIGLCALLCLTWIWSPRTQAQQVEQGVAIVSETIASRVDGFSYSPDSSSELEFVGTSLAPRALGEAGIKVSRDKTEIHGKFQRLPEPSSLGPFAVYCLWVVTPEGRAINVGMLNIDGDRARIDAATPLSSFALIVTAEPHFAVSIPSKDVILQNVGKNVKGVKLAVTSLAAREDYASLKPVVLDKKHPIPLDLEMARYAVAIAEAAGAKALSTVAFERARQSLASAESALVSKKSAERGRVGEYAREAIQAGEDARAGAETRRSGAEKASQADLIKDSAQAFKDEQAKEARLQAELKAAQDRATFAENQIPNTATRLQMASELLSRWFTLQPPSETGFTMHVPEEMFVKNRAELVPQMQERLALTTGVLLGIGKLSVSVTPSVQTSSDMQKLALSQQRARAVMEWFASMGLKAAMGAPSPSSEAIEASLALGPGVDLMIAGSSLAQAELDAIKTKPATP